MSVAKKLDYELLREVEQFLYREARLADERKYNDWEALWTDDGVYWVPANGADIDPETEMSIIYDHRSRIALRVRQFYTGKRFVVEPASSLRRVVSNIELLDSDNDDIKVASNAIIFDSATRGDSIWACSNIHTLRRVDGELKMAFKKVVLVNNDKALNTISFLI
jgi:3-phenylpropionate/cinnamic acid dioxygenase small subunit